MKKIFLTSGLVLCMACPAFAGTPTGGSATSDISAGAAGTNLCVVGVLGTANNGDTTTFNAKWTATYRTIALNVNSDHGAASGATATPTPLYSVAGTSAVWTQLETGTNNLIDANKRSSTQTVLNTPLPTGKTVTYTNFDNNIGANESSVTSSASATSPAREFQGMYTTATGGTQMITADGKLTSDGATEAAKTTLTSNTWYAQYNCKTPTITAPVRPGYQFNGWNTAADGTGTTVSASCLENDYTTKLYAQWTALATTINFSCAKPSNASGTPTMTGDASMTINMDGNDKLATTCSLTGWTFTGWDCTDNALTSDAAGTTKLNGTIPTTQTVYMKSASTVSCTAVYEVNRINTTFTAPNATTAYTATVSANDCPYDGDIALPSNIPSRTGYQFNGWEAVSVTAAQ